MSSAHPGFESAAKSISDRQGVSMDSARAILAAGARRASHSAIKHNKRLKRINGVGKSMSAEDLQKFMDGLMSDVEGELRKMDAIDRAKTLTKFRQLTSIDELCKLAKSQDEMGDGDNSSDPEQIDDDDLQDANVNDKDQVMQATSEAVQGDEDDEDDGEAADKTDQADGQDALSNARDNTNKSDKPSNLKKSFAQKLHQVVQTIQNTNAAGASPGEAASNQAAGGTGMTTGNNVPPNNNPNNLQPQEKPKPKAHPAAAAAAAAFKNHVKGKSDNQNPDDKNNQQPMADDRTPDKMDKTGAAPDKGPQKPFK